MTPELVNGLFGLGGAMLGALIGVGGTWFVTHRFKERRKLNVIVSPLARLVDVGDQIRSDVKILFKNQPVDSLFMGEIAIQNSGNIAVESLDATVTAKATSRIISVEVRSSNFAYDDSTIAIEGDESSQKIAIAFLNPNDRLVLGYMIGDEGVTPSIVLRKLGVDVVTQKDFVGWIPDIYAEVIYDQFSRIPLFNLIGRHIKPFNLYLEARTERERERDS